MYCVNVNETSVISKNNSMQCDNLETKGLTPPLGKGVLYVLLILNITKYNSNIITSYFKSIQLTDLEINASV